MSANTQSASNEGDSGRLESLIDEVLLNTATAQQLQELNSLLQRSNELRLRAITRLGDDAMLRAELEIAASANLFENESSLPGLIEAAGRSDKSESETATQPARGKRPNSYWQSLLRHPNFSMWMQSAVLLLIGSASTMVVYENLPESQDSVALQQAAPIKENESPLVYVAHVVQDTSDLWSTTQLRRIGPGAGLGTGDTVRLSDGIAQLQFNGGLTLYLEGPAEVEIDVNGMPLLRHGRVSIEVPWGDKDSCVATPLGILRVSGESAIGVALYGSELQVHAFEGQVLIDLARAGGEPEFVTVASGFAKHLNAAADEQLRVKEYPLTPGMFASRISMGADKLEITDRYVEAVRQSSPLAYWRFEESAGRSIANEISSKHPCELLAGAKIVPQLGNRAVEFGYGSAAGSISVEEEFTELTGDAYAVELWVKPSHFHHGALINLLRVAQGGEYLGHGLLVELRDPFFGTEARTNAVRFLHRSPVGAGGGTELFSSSNYAVREWQHVVAVKDDSQLKLYKNGNLEAVGEDDSPLPSGLSLLIGKLYPFDSLRPFTGQLDELAVYGHALSADEVRQHYDLGRGSQLSAAEHVGSATQSGAAGSN